jgi:hypothetical protein
MELVSESMEYRTTQNPNVSEDHAVRGSEVSGHTNTVLRPAPPARAKRPDPAAERMSEDMRVFNKVVAELKAKLGFDATQDERCKQVAHFATELFGVSPTWAAFYREVIGKEGVIWSLFPDAEARNEYEASSHYGQILEMLTALRSRDLPENDPTEPQRMVTIRMPKSLYDVLCDESNQLKISVNKLCISRITQRLSSEVVPVTEKKRRGRRPGSAGSDDGVASQDSAVL